MHTRGTVSGAAWACVFMTALGCGGGQAEVDPRVGRMADRLISAANRAEAEVTPIIKTVARNIGARIHKLEQRIKPRSSLIRKIDAVLAGASGLPLSRVIVTDVLRYTLVIEDSPPGNHVEKARAALEALADAGHRVMYGKNYWDPGDPYSGTDVVMETSAGLKWELQLHTEASARINDRFRAMFMELKDLRVPVARRRALYDEISAAWNSVARPKNILNRSSIHERISFVELPRPTGLD